MKDYIIPTIKDGYMAAPALTETIDRKVFKQTPVQRGEAFTVKARHKNELRQVYGANWKKHLNVPEKKLGEVVKMSF